jgi:fluoride ion exporter CrcB/FEX
MVFKKTGQSLSIDFFTVLLVGLAGGLGSVARVQLTKWSGALPFGVILTNTLAATLLGWLLSLPSIPLETFTALSMGLAGGLSTFSAVSKSAFNFYHRGRLTQALLTLLTNLLIPLTALIVVARFA